MARQRTDKVPERRNGYYYINEKQYVSVTKVLKDVLAKPALMIWGMRQAAAIALEDPYLNVDEVVANLQLKVRGSADRGRLVHKYSEELLTSGTRCDTIDTVVRPYIHALYTWHDTHKPVTIANEQLVFSDQYGYAGRCDYICRLNNATWLLDFKTGKDIYAEAGLQLAAYSHALRENNIINIEHTGVLLLTERGEFVFKETLDTIDDFVAVKRVWEWVSKRTK